MAPAAAQDGAYTMPAPDDLPRGPLRLFPLPGTGAGAEADDGPAAKAAPEAPREVREGIVAIDDLGAVSAEAAGLLDPADSGLPADLWQGSEHTVIARALASLPVSAPSRSRSDLARRLLLATAAPPAAADSATAAGTPAAKADLLTLRLDRLLAMGATAEARALADAVSPDARPGAAAEPLRRTVADAWLVDNRLDEACAVIADGLTRFDGIYWQKASTFCDLVQGRPQAASLRLAMLREQGLNDEAFQWAAEQLAGLRVLSLNGLSHATPLTVAMMRETGRPYPAGTLVDPQPWLLRAVALGDKTDTETRLRTAEQAFLAGALDRDGLTALYDGLTFSDAAFATPLPEVAGRTGVRANALLWQMARRQPVPVAQAEVIAVALEAAETNRQGLLAAYLYAPVIAAMPRTPDLMWFVPVAGRALYGAGRPEEARSWFRLAAEAAATSSEAAQAADALWPLDRIATESTRDRWPPRRLAAWRQTLDQRAGESGEPAAQRRSRLESLVLSLFQATGDRVTAADWAPLFDTAPAADWAPLFDTAPAAGGAGGAGASLPAWHAVTEATDALRVGESALLALMILGDAPPDEVSGAALSRAVESLRLVGLEDPARRIAAESAVAAGL
jgi:hypothetical protein